MTTITMLCDHTSKDFVGFEIKGHAGYAKSGDDIVCAAISVLSITIQNAIETLCPDDFFQESEEISGYMYFCIKGEPSHDALTLLTTASMGFEGIAKQYRKYVKMKIKEV